MTKIVINACYGGFSISEAAVYALASRKGLSVYKDGERWKTVYWTTPNTDPGRIQYEIICKNWSNESLRNRRAATVFHDANTISIRPNDRADPDIIAVIEELGDDANGACARLEIVELQPGTLYRITEYDGLESVETCDNVDWKAA